MRKFSPRTRQGFPNSTVAAVKNWLPPSAQLVYATEVLADSPYLYWRLGDASGTTATDSSGNGRNGTYTNTPTLDQTPLITVNKSTDFNGTDEYVTWTTTAALTGNFTFECWINADALSGFQGLISGWNASTSGNYGAILALNDATVEIYAANSTFTGWSYTDTTGYSLSTATTYHLVFVNDDTNNVGYLYSNGDLQYTASSKTTAMGLVNNAKNFVAGRATNTSGYFNGRIDEVAVYTTALSAARIKQHYLAGIGGVQP